MYDLKGSKKLQSSTEVRPIFEDPEGSRPRSIDLDPSRPRTSKTVLEAATSVGYSNNQLNCYQVKVTIRLSKTV